MKKITFKLTAFITLLVLLIQGKAQTQNFPFPYDVNFRAGTWLLKVQGGDLFITLPTDTPSLSRPFTQYLTYQQLNTTNPELQRFTTTQAPGNDNWFYIESVIPGRGVLELDFVTSETPSIVVRGNAKGLTSRLDVWNPTREMGTAIFSENTNEPDFAWFGRAKRRVRNDFSDQGLNIVLSGSSPLRFEWLPVISLSNANFDTSSIFIANPVNENLNITGLNANINVISIYSLIGKKVLTHTSKQQSEINLDVRTLKAGIYIIKFQHDKGKFTKKILKK